MDEMNWYSVRCLFEHPTRRRDADIPLYEERTLLWHGASWSEAHEKARCEAQVYAKEASCTFIKVTDSFWLFADKLKEGIEVFSNMRDSNLDPDTYADTFCCTPRDRVHNNKE